MSRIDDFVVIKMKAEINNEWLCKMSLLHETVLRCMNLVGVWIVLLLLLCVIVCGWVCCVGVCVFETYIYRKKGIAEDKIQNKNVV